MVQETFKKGLALKPWAERTNLRRCSARDRPRWGASATACLLQSQVTAAVAGRDAGAASVQLKRRPAGALAGDRSPGLRPPGPWSRTERRRRGPGPSKWTEQRPLPSPPCRWLSWAAPPRGPPCVAAGTGFCSLVVRTAEAVTGRAGGDSLSVGSWRPGHTCCLTSLKLAVPGDPTMSSHVDPGGHGPEPPVPPQWACEDGP